MKEKYPVLYFFITSGSTLIAILGFIAILEDKSLLPQNSFKIFLFISLAFYIIIAIIVCLFMIWRPYYIDAQLKAFESSQDSIYLSIHSLNSESKKNKYKLFNNAIEKAKKRKINVKILAPCGIKRIRGAYEMCVEHDLIDNIRLIRNLKTKTSDILSLMIALY